MRIKILTTFFLTILFISGSNGNDLPEYTPMAFTQGGFQNFNEKYLGNSPYFYMPVISPKYIENNITLIGEAVDQNIDNIFTESKKWWIPSFVQNRTDIELRKTLHEAVKNGLSEFRHQDYIKDLWGVCVANSNNDENGEENLFVFIDPVQGKLASIDFGHPEDISSFISMGIDQLKNSFFKFKINANSIVVPSTNVLLLPDGELELKDPRGICTNRKGRFWIADRGNNRIVHLKYDPDRKAFTYLGQLTGLNSPMDVSIIESENASDPLVLCIANSGENNIVYVNADISGTVALSGITDEQKFVIYGVLGSLNVKFTRPMSVSNCSADKNIMYVAYDNNKIGILKRDGRFSFYYVGTIDWPADGLITCIKSDYDGNLFVIDNTNCTVGKYDKNNNLLFTSGRFWNGLVENAGMIGFNNPKYLAIGKDYDNFFVTEKWDGYNGLKKFSYVPRFMEHSARFNLNCDDNPNDGRRHGSFEWSLTKDGYVSFEVSKRQGDTWVPVISSNGRIPCNQGQSKIENYLFVDQAGNPLSGEGIYQCNFSAYRKPDDLNSLSHTEIYKIDLRSPRILHDFVGVSQEFFNPDPSVNTRPKVTFQISRDAMVNFYLVNEDGSGGKFNVWPGDLICYRNSPENNSEMDHNIQLDIENVPSMMPLKSYLLKATMMGFPECGAMANDIQLFRAENVPVRIYLDDIMPEPVNFVFKLPSGLLTKAFNPENRNFEGVNISSDAPLSDNSGIANGDLTYSLRIYNPNTGKTVKTIYDNKHTNGQQIKIESDWDGSDDQGNLVSEGSYIVEAVVRDVAGNIRTSTEALAIDKIAPSIVLNMASGYTPDFYSNNGIDYLALSNDIQLNFTVTDNLALPHQILFEVTDKSGLFDLTYKMLNAPLQNYGSDPTWSGTVTVPVSSSSLFLHDGAYQLHAYAIDRAGNRSQKIAITDPRNSGNTIENIWINKTGPAFTAVATPSAIKSGGSSTICIDARASNTIDKSYSYEYTVDIVNENTGVTVSTFNGTINENTGLLELKYTHQTSHNIGKFVVTVSLNDGIGTGISTTQNTFLLVDSYKPSFDRTGIVSIPEKFYIRGQVGDPDLTNDKNEHGFESYQVFIRPGVLTSLPSDITGWLSDGVINVPFDKIDRNRTGLTTFPFTNVGDGEAAQTEQWGQSVLAYIDGSTLSDGPHTILVIAKEKGKSLVINQNTAAMRIVSIDKSLNEPNFTGSVALNGIENGNVSINFTQNGNEKLTIEGRIAQNVPSGGSNREVNIIAHIFREMSAGDVGKTPEPMVAKLKAERISGDKYKIEWDGKSKGGQYVRNGDYRIVLAMEEVVEPGTQYCFDKVFLSSRLLKVTTPLHIVNCDLTPMIISKWPAGGTGPQGNITTFMYTISKPCDFYFDVFTHDPNNLNIQKLCTIGPKFSDGGIEYSHVFNWDGINTETGEHVIGNSENGSVRIKPFAVPENTENVNAITKQYYDPDLNSDIDYFLLQFTNLPEENTSLGNYSMGLNVYGNSDAIWETRLNADFWSFPAFTTGVDFWAKGIQTVKMQQPVRFENFAFKKSIKEIEFNVKVKWGINRKKRAVRYYYHTGRGSNGWRTNGYITEECGQITSAGVDFSGMPCAQGGTAMCNEDPNRATPDYVFMEKTIPFRIEDTQTNINWSTGWVNEDSYSWDNLDGCQRCFEYNTLSGHCITDLCLIFTSGRTKVVRKNRGSRTSYFETIIEGEPRIEWIRVFTKSGTLVASIFETGNIPDVPSSTTGIFTSNDPDGSVSVNENDALAQGIINIDWQKFHSTDWVPLFNGETSTFISLLPSENGDFVDVSSGLDPGWATAIQELVPVNGKASFSAKGKLPKGGPFPGTYFQLISPVSVFVENTTSSTKSFEYEWPFSIGSGDDKNIHYEGMVKLHSDATTPAVEVPGVCMPFPTAAGQCYVNGNDVKNNSIFRWVMSGGKEDAVHPNDGDHFKVQLNMPITLYAGSTFDSDISNSVTPVADPAHDVEYQEFLFPPSGDCGLIDGCQSKTTHGGKINWQLNGTRLTVNYPLDETSKTLESWNTLGAKWQDPVLLPNNYSIRGYYRANYFDPSHNVDGLHSTPATFGNSFSEFGATASIAEAYKTQAQKAGITIPVLNTSNHWTTLSEQQQQFAFWFDENSNLRLHDGEAMTLGANPWTSFTSSEVGFRYIDGTENNCLELEGIISNGQLSFRPRITANAIPKRIVPIDFNFTSDMVYPLTIRQCDVMVYNIEMKQWEAALVKEPLTITEKGLVTLGYWDATFKSGTFIVRVVMHDNHSNPHQVTTSINVGTKVESGVPIDVVSPLRRVTLRFTSGSRFNGMVAVNPILPQQFGISNIPDGFFVDISPSNVMFGAGEEPQLIFYISQRDLASVGNPSNLGDIGIYYIDPQRKLARANCSAIMYNTTNGTTRPVDNTFQADEVLTLNAPIKHFSVYGAFNDKSFVSIDPPNSPTAGSTVTLSGVISETNRNNIHLYIWGGPEWDPSAIEIAPSQINVTQDGDGNWHWKAENINLVNIENYIFASIGKATISNPPKNNVKVVRDTDKPVIVSVDITPQYSNDTSDIVNVSVELSEPGDVHCQIPSIMEDILYIKAEENTNYRAKITIPLFDKNHNRLKDGSYKLIISANDLVGNSTDNPTVANFIIDRTAPVLTDIQATILQRSGSGINCDLLTSAKIQDQSGITDVKISIEGHETRWNFTRNYSGLMNADINSTIALDGFGDIYKIGDVIQLIFEVKDVAGNSNTFVHRVIYSANEDMSQWSYSKPVIINKGNNNSGQILDNIPILIRLDRANFNFSQAAEDGHDIRFVDENLFMCPYEIEYWDSDKQDAAIWVLISNLNTNVNKQLTMYWGNMSASQAYFSKLVWDKNFKGVYHVNEGSQFGIPDGYAIYALKNITIGDRGIINGGMILSDGDVILDHECRVDASINSGKDVVIGDRSIVERNVSYKGMVALLAGATVNGTVSQIPEVGSYSISVKNVTYNDNNISVEKGKTVTLNPGTYGRVEVYEYGKLVLMGGTYQLKELDLGNDAILEINLKDVSKNIEISVEDALIFRARSKMAFSESSSSPLSVNIYTNQSEPLVFENNTILFGSFSAPYADIELNSRCHFTGNLRAQRVIGQPDITFNSLCSSNETGSIKSASGLLMDATINQNHGTKFGTVENESIIGKGLLFNGTTNIVECPSMLNKNDNPYMTISTWIKPIELQDNNNFIAIANTGSGWKSGLQADGSLYLNSTVGNITTSIGTVGNNEWHHIAFQYDGNSIIFYVNGREVTRQVTENPLSADDVKLTIGNWIEASGLNGIMDEIRVSDISRSKEWIAFEYAVQNQQSRIVSVPFNSPTGINLTQIGKNCAVISWNSDFESVDYLEIEKNSKGTWESLVTVPFKSGSFIDNDITCESKYYYRYRYISGNQISQYSETQSITTGLCAEKWPIEFYGTPYSYQTIRLNWVDKSGGMVSYEIEKNDIETQVYIPFKIVEPDITSYDVTNLECEDKYDFRIRALQGIFHSDWIYSKDVFSGYCNLKPVAPSELNVEISQEGFPYVTWKDNSDNEELFIVYRKDDRLLNATLEIVGYVGANVTEYVDISAVCGKKYSYSVTAFNSVNGGGLSNNTALSDIETSICIEDRSANLVQIACMLVDAQKNAVNDNNANIFVRLYNNPASSAPFYQEQHNIEVRNGFVLIELGQMTNIRNIIGQESYLSYDITYNGNLITERLPLCSSGGQITNRMVYQGKGSPIGYVDGELGSLYLNIENQELYFKYGESKQEWKKVE